MVEDGAADLYMGRLKLLGIEHTLKPFSLDADKVRFALKTQHFYSFLDSADLCQFVWGPAWTLYGPSETVEMVKALKPKGRLVFVEYRLEDAKVPIKLVHKMSEKQVRKEMADFPLRYVQTIDVLPWRHVIIFEKK